MYRHDVIILGTETEQKHINWGGPLLRSLKIPGYTLSLICQHPLHPQSFTRQTQVDEPATNLPRTAGWSSKPEGLSSAKRNRGSTSRLQQYSLLQKFHHWVGWPSLEWVRRYVVWFLQWSSLPFITLQRDMFLPLNLIGFAGLYYQSLLKPLCKQCSWARRCHYWTESTWPVYV